MIEVDRPSPFETAFAVSAFKLKRARKHIRDLRDCLQRFVETDMFEPGTQQLVQQSATVHLSGGLVFRAPPPETAAIIGDVLHNLRSSLDVMAFELAGKQEDDAKSAAFPFAKSLTDLPAKIKQQRFDLCGKEAVEVLLAQAPYEGGNADLMAIHRLNIIDKHRSIAPRPKMNFTMQIGFHREDDGSKTPFARPAADRPPIFTLGDDTGLGDAEIFEILDRLVVACERVLDAFAPLAKR